MSLTPAEREMVAMLRADVAATIRDARLALSEGPHSLPNTERWANTLSRAYRLEDGLRRLRCPLTVPSDIEAQITALARQEGVSPAHLDVALSLDRREIIGHKLIPCDDRQCERCYPQGALADPDVALAEAADNFTVG